MSDRNPVWGVFTDFLSGEGKPENYRLSGACSWCPPGSPRVILHNTSTALIRHLEKEHKNKYNAELKADVTAFQAVRAQVRQAAAISSGKLTFNVFNISITC